MRLRRARDDGRLDREAALIGKARLLVIDELGFLPLDADGARLLFQVFADAYERQSVVITTNLEFSRWGSVFGDDQMAAAVIDRIVHHGRLVQFRGESYLFVSSSGFQLRQRFFSHVARKGFRFGKGVPLSLFGFA
ncbi:ATP-binding protein, partial [Collinsella sp. HCP28S3_F2]|uniref:ATP-binding protein n=1 Tax=unclassified Collinsella TaxID=2637548 RepID=UPI003F8B514A